MMDSEKRRAQKAAARKAWNVIIGLLESEKYQAMMKDYLG